MKPTIKQHEDKYIHISKRFLWIFAPLGLIPLTVYMIWILLMSIITVIAMIVIFIISSLSSFDNGTAGKDAREMLTDLCFFKKETFIDLRPAIWNKEYVKENLK